MIEHLHQIRDYCASHFIIQKDLKIMMSNCYIGLATNPYIELTTKINKDNDKITELGLGFYTYSTLPKLLFKYNISKVESYQDFEKDTEYRSNVACIGFSESQQGWLGWSHRACFFFKIGYVVEEGSLCTETGWLEDYAKQHPEKCFNLPIGFTCETLDDCRKCAIAYAMAVA